MATTQAQPSARNNKRNTNPLPELRLPSLHPRRPDAELFPSDSVKLPCLSDAALCFPEFLCFPELRCSRVGSDLTADEYSALPLHPGEEALNDPAAHMAG